MVRSVNGIGRGTTKLVGHDPVIAVTTDDRTYDLDLKVDNSTIVINDDTGELNAVAGAVDIDAVAPLVYPGNDPAGPKLSMKVASSLVVNGANALQVNPGAFIDDFSLEKIPDDVALIGGRLFVNTLELIDNSTLKAPIVPGEAYVPARIQVNCNNLIDRSDINKPACLSVEPLLGPEKHQRLRVDSDQLLTVVAPEGNGYAIEWSPPEFGPLSPHVLRVNGEKLKGKSLLWNPPGSLWKFEVNVDNATIASDAVSGKLKTKVVYAAGLKVTTIADELTVTHPEVTVNVDNATIATDTSTGKLKTKVVYGEGLVVLTIADELLVTHPEVKVDYTKVASKQSLTEVEETANYAKEKADANYASIWAIPTGLEARVTALGVTVTAHTADLTVINGFLAGFLVAGGASLTTVLALKQDKATHLTELSDAENPSLSKPLTVTGTVTASTPTAPTHLATKQYVDDVAVNNITAGTGLTKTGTTIYVNAAQPGITSLGNLTTLQVDGVAHLHGGSYVIPASAGEARHFLWNRSAHAWYLGQPSGTDNDFVVTYNSGAYLADFLRIKANGSGMDVQGTVTASAPTANNHLATKQYVDAAAAGAGSGTFQPLNAHLTQLSDPSPHIDDPLTVPKLTVTVAGTGASVPVDILQAALATDTDMSLRIGAAATSGNAAHFSFQKTSTGSLASFGIIGGVAATIDNDGVCNFPVGFRAGFSPFSCDPFSNINCPANFTMGGHLILSGDITATSGAQAMTVGSTGAVTFPSNIVLSSGATGPPTFTTRSAGSRAVLYPALSPTATDYAIGIQGGALWFGVPDTGSSFRFYGGTTNNLTLGANGTVTCTGASGAVTAPTVTGTKLISGGTLKLRADTTGSDYSIIYSGGLPVRLSGADDADAHRTYQFGYHTGDVATAAWNSRASIDTYDGSGTFQGTVTATGTITSSTKLIASNPTAGAGVSLLSLTGNASSGAGFALQNSAVQWASWEFNVAGPSPPGPASDSANGGIFMYCGPQNSYPFGFKSTGQAFFNQPPQCASTPTATNHLVNKAYVDNTIVAMGGGGPYQPLNSNLTNFGDTATINSLGHVTLPGTLTVASNASFGATITAAAAPLASAHLANKGYVDGRTSGQRLQKSVTGSTSNAISCCSLVKEVGTSPRLTGIATFQLVGIPHATLTRQYDDITAYIVGYPGATQWSCGTVRVYFNMTSTQGYDREATFYYDMPANDPREDQLTYTSFSLQINGPGLNTIWTLSGVDGISAEGSMSAWY